MAVIFSGVTSMENFEKHLGDIASYECSSSGIDQLTNTQQRVSISVVNVCLNMKDQALSKIFMNREHRKALVFITRLGLHLLYNIETLNVSDLDHLHNSGLFMIKLMHNVYIEESCKDYFFESFLSYKHESVAVAECILRHIQSIREPSLVKVVCLWLDTLTHYQYITRDSQNKFPELANLCERAIIKENDLHGDARRCGSVLFHLAFMPNSTLQFDDIILFKWRQYVILQTKEVDTWSTNIRHSVMGCVCLLGNRFFARLSNYDEEFDRSLLTIATDSQLQRALHSEWTNDGTILIHAITEYFMKNLWRHWNMKTMLREASNHLRSLYRNAKYELTKMNVCYLILAVANDEHPVSDDVLMGYFQYIEVPYQSVPRKENVFKTRERLLRGLAGACRFNSIKDAIVRLNKIHTLSDLIQDYPEVIREILFFLPTSLTDQSIFKDDATTRREALFFEESPTTEDSFRALQTKFHLPTRHPRSGRGPYIPPSLHPHPPPSPPSNPTQAASPAFDLRNRSKVVISCSNAQVSNSMQRHLRRHMLSLLILKEYGDSLEKEKFIVKSKCMIACLSDDYDQHRPELILAYKHQVPIIPILIQTEIEYVLSDPFLKFIAAQHSSSSNLIHLKDFEPAMALLLAKIRHLRSSSIHETPSYLHRQLHTAQRLPTQASVSDTSN